MTVREWAEISGVILRQAASLTAPPSRQGKIREPPVFELVAAECQWHSAIGIFEDYLIQSKIPKSAFADLGILVRVARLELAASWSQTRRPTSWATPG